MSVCTQCGHPLGVGSFCTNCGQPVDRTGPVSEEPILGDDDWRTGTAERPALIDDSEPTVVVRRPVLPPPVQTPNEAPRYPLFADEVTQSPSPPPPAPAYVAPVELAPDPSLEPRRHVGERPPRSAAAVWVPWLVGLVVLLVIGSLGIWLLFGNDDATPTAADPTASDTAAGQEPSEDEPKASDKPDKENSPKPGKRTDVTRSATADVPATAPPNEDVDGNMVRYEGRNMLDGVPETTWRMAGDGTGKTITFELAEPTTITELAIVNGYAKTATDGGRTLDWYKGNRRVLAVEWVLDDGTTITQDLAKNTRDFQTIKVEEGAPTESVQLRLVEVSAPGSGKAGRDYTAISEVSLIGNVS